MMTLHHHKQPHNHCLLYLFLNPVPLSSAQVQKPNTAITPTGAQYPLELIAVREEIKSFYTEDDPAKRSLPSLEGYPRPNNIEEYMKLKAQQVEDISKRNSHGKSDKEIQRYYQYLLTQVRTLEQFAKKSLSATIRKSR